MIAPHGSPRDRGESDSYYGRQYRPHRWLDGLGRQEVLLTDPADIAEYHAGYDGETDRKDWGRGTASVPLEERSAA